jgi:predicted  nucleic acid-binding Zn-ribbon protein
MLARFSLEVHIRYPCMSRSVENVVSTPGKFPVEHASRIAELEGEVSALQALVETKTSEISSLKTSMEAMSALNQAAGARYASELSRLKSEVDLANQRAQSSQSLRSPAASDGGDEDVDFGSSGDEAIGLLDTTPSAESSHRVASRGFAVNSQPTGARRSDDEGSDDEYAGDEGASKLQALEAHTASLQSAINEAHQELDRLRASKDDEVTELQSRIGQLEDAMVEKQQELDDIRERLAASEQARIDAEQKQTRSVVETAALVEPVTNATDAQLEHVQRENEMLRTRFIAAAEMAETASGHLNGLKAQVDHLSSQVMYLYTSRAEAFEKVSELQQQQHQLQLEDGVRFRADSGEAGSLEGPANGAALLMSAYTPVVDTRASTPTSARDRVVHTDLALLNVPSPFRGSGGDPAEEAVSRGQIDRALHAVVHALTVCKEQLEVWRIVCRLRWLFLR